MLIAASAIAVVANRLRITYTVALVVGGLALVAFYIPLVDEIICQEPGSPLFVLVRDCGDSKRAATWMLVGHRFDGRGHDRPGL
jgi:hypothetical protein